MVVYVSCPHCSHPTVIPHSSTGRHRLCRQCYGLYFVNYCTSLIAEADVSLPGENSAHTHAASGIDAELDAMLHAAIVSRSSSRSALAG